MRARLENIEFHISSYGSGAKTDAVNGEVSGPSATF